MGNIDRLATIPNYSSEVTPSLVQVNNEQRFKDFCFAMAKAEKVTISTVGDWVKVTKRGTNEVIAQRNTKTNVKYVNQEKWRFIESFKLKHGL